MHFFIFGMCALQLWRSFFFFLKRRMQKAWHYDALFFIILIEPLFFFFGFKERFFPLSTQVVHVTHEF